MLFDSRMGKRCYSHEQNVYGKKKKQLKNPAGMNLGNTMLRTRSQTPKEHILRDWCEVQNQVRLTYGDQKKKKS